MSLGGEADIRFHQDTKTICSNANTQSRCSVRMRASLERVPENKEASLLIKITLNEQSQQLTGATSHGYIYKIEDSKAYKKNADILRQASSTLPTYNRSTLRFQNIMSYFNIQPMARKFSAQSLVIGASDMAKRAMKACKELHMAIEINIVTLSLVQDDGDVVSRAKLS